MHEQGVHIEIHGAVPQLSGGAFKDRLKEDVREDEGTAASDSAPLLPPEARLNIQTPVSLPCKGLV